MSSKSTSSKKRRHKDFGSLIIPPLASLSSRQLSVEKERQKHHNQQEQLQNTEQNDCNLPDGVVNGSSTEEGKKIEADESTAGGGESIDDAEFRFSKPGCSGPFGGTITIPLSTPTKPLSPKRITKEKKRKSVSPKRSRPSKNVTL